MAELSFPRGTTYRIGVKVQENGNPKDLTNSTLRLTVKSDQYDQNIDDLTAIITKNIPGDSSGVANFVILPIDTQSKEPGVYYYDIKVENGNDNQNIYLIDSGTVELVGTPTNRLD